MKISLSNFTYMGVVSAAIYILFATTAYLYYPTTYSPLNNWLSDLGNPTANPTGAIFYELAGTLTSICLVPFLIGVNAWNTGDRKVKIFLTVSQITGLIAAASFFMTAIFPLGVNNEVHSFFSIMIFVFFGFFEVFSASGLRRKVAAPRWLVYSGFATAFASFGIGVFSFFNHDFFLGEWITVGLLIFYVLALAANLKRLTQKISSVN
jgi:hypothetical protein